MADVKISDLSAAASASTADLLEVEQSGPTSKYATLAQLLAAAGSTSVTIGSAATTLALGANSGTLTIGNSTVVGTQTTQALWNTVATTINFGGAATTLTIGSSTCSSTVNGIVGIGGGPNSQYGLNIVHTALSGTVQYGVVSTVTATSASTSGTTSFAGQVGTANASFTAATCHAFRAFDANKGAASTITTLIGFQCDDLTKGGTANRGFVSSVSSGSGKWNLYFDGTAANHIAGELLLGHTTTSGTTALSLVASTTGKSSARIPSGTAPTSPVSGDLWYDGTNLKFRDGATTRTITWT